MEDNCVELCNIGDIIYRVCKDQIIKQKVLDIKHYPHCVYELDNNSSYFNRAFGKTLFKTIEEATEAMQTKDNVIKKRELLKEYERELNKKFGLENHKIVK